MTASLRTAKATGATAIALTFAPAVVFRLIRVTVHFGVAPVTSQDLTVTLNALAGAAYDTVLYRENPSVGALTDISFEPEDDQVFQNGDQIDVAYTNTDGRTYGAEIVVEAV
jgi:hypothetical protein